MDRKSIYFISAGIVIIFTLFMTLMYHHSHSKVEKHEIVKEELQSPDEVKGVFKNVYAAKQEAPIKEDAEEIDANESKEESPIIEENLTDKKTEAAPVLEAGVIKMENKAYPKHTKAIVLFTHLGHIEKHKLKCGDCHHDSNVEPLNNLTFKDKVQGCIECHNKPGQKPKGAGVAAISPSEEILYHAEALHQNCIGCHKKSNETTGKKTAPVSCAQCHMSK